MKEFVIYLNFNGNCREAMKFYRDCLGGELDLMDFTNAPLDVPNDYRDKIVHASLIINDNCKIYASDTLPGDTVKFGNNISISIECNSPDENALYFEKLAMGGKVIMPLQDTFWEAKFGMLLDKFDVQWMLSYEKPKTSI